MRECEIVLVELRIDWNVAYITRVRKDNPVIVFSEPCLLSEQFPSFRENSF